MNEKSFQDFIELVHFGPCITHIRDLLWTFLLKSYIHEWHENSWLIWLMYVMHVVKTDKFIVRLNLSSKFVKGGSSQLSGDKSTSYIHQQRQSSCP